MVNERMYALGYARSAIRELFEYGRKRKAEIGAENVFDFSLGNPAIAPPDEVNETLVELLMENPVGVHSYTQAQGDLDTRTAIAYGINQKFSAGMTPNLIYMTCGAAAALTITFGALCSQGDEVVVFAPYFPEYKVFIENAGAKAVVSKPDADMSIDFADFTKKLSPAVKAVVINSPNNPTGAVYSQQTIARLAVTLEVKSEEFGHPIYLIADEPYRELVYGNVEVPYIMNFYANSIVCYSYSKTLSLPGERIGYIAVCPRAEDSDKVYSAVCGAGRSLGYVCAPSLFQYLIGRVDGACSDVEKYRENRDIIYGALKRLGYDCIEPKGAFYLFIKSPSGDAEEFCERAKKHEILIVPSTGFGTPGYARLAYCVASSVITASLPAFESLIKEYTEEKK